MKTRIALFFVCCTLFACGIFSPPDQPAISSLPSLQTASQPLPTPPSTSSEQTIQLGSAENDLPHTDMVARPDFPPPTENPAIPLPPLAASFPFPSDTVNILLLGSDERGPFSGIRTDTILLVSFQPKQGKISMLSFPRDLYVYIPGWTVRRINEAYQRGGFDLLADTFDYNFGIRPTYFVLVNFEAFQQAVDNLGGIDVQVGKALREGDYSVKPGAVHMDGEMALWYVRSRYTTSDFERMTRQQEVMVALFHRLISMNALKQVPQLYAVYDQSITTNIPLRDVLSWINAAGRIVEDPANLQSQTLNRNYVTPFKTPGGAQVLLPEREAIFKLFDEIFLTR
ncbi:MAG: LCP family protein [Anaerolineales bacterium]|nr:LCP family protein [Anaerolineales bacterium]